MINKQNETEEKKLLKPKNDLVFQSLFTQKNEYITKEFVSALLNEKIDYMVINDTKELFREYPTDKLGILDLEVEVNGNEKVDIDVQVSKKEDFIDRLLFYFARLYERQINKGDTYDISKRVVIIAIIDYEFELTKNLEQMVTQWLLRESKNLGLVLTDKIEINIIELNKAKKEYNKNKEDKRAQWMMFMNNPEDEEVKAIMKENEAIKEATIEIRKMSQDEKMQKLAELREKAIRDEKSCYNTGLHDGIKQGQLDARKEIAKEMLKEKIKLEIIAKTTGLTIEEIKQLQTQF